MSKMTVNVIYGDLKPTQPVLNLIGNHVLQAVQLQDMLTIAIHLRDQVKSDGDQRTVLDAKIKEISENYQHHTGTYN